MDCSTFLSIFLFGFFFRSRRREFGEGEQFSYLQVFHPNPRDRRADAKYCEKRKEKKRTWFPLRLALIASFEAETRGFKSRIHSIHEPPVMDYQSFFALIHLALPSLRKDSVVKSLFQFLLIWRRNKMTWKKKEWARAILSNIYYEKRFNFVHSFCLTFSRTLGAVNFILRLLEYDQTIFRIDEESA